MALLLGTFGPVIGAVDVAVADPDGALVGMVGLGVFFREAGLIAGHFGAVGGEHRPEIGTPPVGIVGRGGEAVGGEGLAVDLDG
jgi:hypothetical protein